MYFLIGYHTPTKSYITLAKGSQIFIYFLGIVLICWCSFCYEGNDEQGRSQFSRNENIIRDGLDP